MLLYPIKFYRIADILTPAFGSKYLRIKNLRLSNLLGPYNFFYTVRVHKNRFFYRINFQIQWSQFICNRPSIDAYGRLLFMFFMHFVLTKNEFSKMYFCFTMISFKIAYHTVIFYLFFSKL